MKKRVRKKLRLAEFREYLFGIKYCLRAPATQAADDFLWRFVEQAIEANHLSCGGGGSGNTWELYVSAMQGKLSEAHRAVVGDWLLRQPEVKQYQVSELFDGWHGPEEAPYVLPAVNVGE